MSLLHSFLLVVLVLLCLLLIGAILLQTGRGGGLAGLGGGAGESAFGVHTANVLQKFTGVCVFLFFLLVIILSHVQADNRDENESSVLDGSTPTTDAPQNPGEMPPPPGQIPSPTPNGAPVPPPAPNP